MKDPVRLIFLAAALALAHPGAAVEPHVPPGVKPLASAAPGGRGPLALVNLTHLVLGQATVKTHVSHLLAKLGARDRAGLVVAAYEAGLVRPGHA